MYRFQLPVNLPKLFIITVRLRYIYDLLLLSNRFHILHK